MPILLDHLVWNLTLASLPSRRNRRSRSCIHSSFCFLYTITGVYILQKTMVGRGAKKQDAGMGMAIIQSHMRAPNPVRGKSKWKKFRKNALKLIFLGFKHLTILANGKGAGFSHNWSLLCHWSVGHVRVLLDFLLLLLVLGNGELDRHVLHVLGYRHQGLKQMRNELNTYIFLLTFV